MEFEEHFGVKVDICIPDQDKRYFFEQWKRWLADKDRYSEFYPQNVLTRYEHFLIGSGVGLSPDPFKPLAAIAQDSDLEAVIRYRREQYPASSILKTFPSKVPNFQELTGLEPDDYHVLIQLPDITPDGRVRIPRVVGVSHWVTEEIVEIGDAVLNQLKLTRKNVFGPVNSGAYLREVFDFDNGYRLELASAPKQR